MDIVNRYEDFDFDKRFRICRPLLKSDTRNKTIQNQSFIYLAVSKPIKLLDKT